MFHVRNMTTEVCPPRSQPRTVGRKDLDFATFGFHREKPWWFCDVGNDVCKLIFSQPGGEWNGGFNIDNPPGGWSFITKSYYVLIML